MTEPHDDSFLKPASSKQSGDVEDIRRRDLLSQMGRFAYAAPALALLAQPRAAQADYGGGRGGVRDGSGGRGKADSRD